jgi:O-acetyl-ADP-ribose deacetylase (regulator of RNase III)
MIKYIKKDILTIKEGVIAHGVNCSGAMNAGLAKGIRNKWPRAYERFKTNGKGKHLLGTTDYVFVEMDEISGRHIIIINCYTQQFYGFGGGRYADIKAVASAIKEAVQTAFLYSDDLYMPKIGCGLGGLNWNKDVKPIVEDAATGFPTVNIFICDL